MARPADRTAADWLSNEKKTRRHRERIKVGETKREERNQRAAIFFLRCLCAFPDAPGASAIKIPRRHNGHCRHCRHCAGAWHPIGPLSPKKNPPSLRPSVLLSTLARRQTFRLKVRHFGKKTRRPNGQSGAVHVILAIIMRPSSTPDWLSIEASVQSGAASTPPVPIYAATPSPLAATFPKKKTRRRSVRVALPLVGFIGSPEKTPPTQPLPTLHRISLAPTSGLPQRCTPTRFLPSFFSIVPRLFVGAGLVVGLL